MQAIVGGNVVPPQAYAFVVMLSMMISPNLTVWCSGSHVGLGVVLTAAHCVRGVPSNRVLAILGDSYAYTATDIKVHPLHNPITNSYDAALLYLNGTSDSAVVGIDTRWQTPGTPGTILGFGVTSSAGTGRFGTLRRAHVVVRDPKHTNLGDSIDESMMVASGEVIQPDGTVADGCQGDSGGPLLTTEGELMGLTSWYPGVYARISSIAEWLAEH
jgi:trypsin